MYPVTKMVVWNSTVRLII